jgi:hypothetical protein
MLWLKDTAFEVDRQRSEFFAYIPQEPPGHPSPGRLRWALEIYCVDKEYERGISAPYLNSNELAFDVGDWRMIEGQTVRDEGGKGLAAYLYVREPERTSDNSIRFLARRGNLFTIGWECLADVFWDDEYSSGLPLRLSTEIAFHGVHVWWLKADDQGLTTAKELVGRHFDLDCLQEPEVAGPYHIVFPARLDAGDVAPARE